DPVQDRSDCRQSAVSERRPAMTRQSLSCGMAALALGGLITAAYLGIGADPANARFGGFRGGDGGARFGDGGFDDRGADSGFGRGGYGSVHSADDYSDRSDRYDASHPE